MRSALVTIAIGGKYEGIFRRLCHGGWKAYAEAIGSDLIVITEPLDHSERARSRSPAWQKLLVFSQPRLLKYDSEIRRGMLHRFRCSHKPTKPEYF